MADLPTCVFLPGIIAPAVIRYGPLIAELGADADARTKELEIYTLSPPSSGYGIDFEVDALESSTRRAGLERFHLYGHSAGGAVALAFTAAHPDRVLSLALDEAAFDFSEEMRAELAGHFELEPLLRERPQEAMPQFLHLEVAEGVELEPPPGAPLPNRPAGIAAILRAFASAQVDLDALGQFEPPVLYTRGSLSATRYARSAQRLAQLFPNFEEVVFEGLHHLNTSHQAQPARVAALLHELWQRS